MADYFFKDHKPWLRSGKPYGLDQSRSSRHMARIT